MTHYRSLFAAVILSAAALCAVRVQAITYGFVDTTNAFGNTGAFIVKAPSGRIYPICSGTLISPSVFLTASHCTVYFEQELEPAGYTAAVSFDKVDRTSVTLDPALISAIASPELTPGLPAPRTCTAGKLLKRVSVPGPLEYSMRASERSGIISPAVRCSMIVLWPRPRKGSFPASSS